MQNKFVQPRKSKKFILEYSTADEEMKILENDISDIFEQALFKAGDTRAPAEERLSTLEMFAGYKLTQSLGKLLESNPRVAQFSVDGYNFYSIESTNHRPRWVFYDRGFCSCGVQNCEHIYLLDIWITHRMPVETGKMAPDEFALNLFNALG